MIDHVSIGVSDLERATRFYQAVLAPLGYSQLRDRPGTVGFGKAHPEFWLNQRSGPVAADGMHVCLRAPTAAAVDAFHRAALGEGARDDGAPGLRPHYNARYYAAFIRDQD